MIDKKIKDDIFIINCDTLIKLDFSKHAKLSQSSQKLYYNSCLNEKT